MEKTSKSMRLHIGIFGKRNAGKSTLINIMTHQETSIVSQTPGTTTDAVEKVMEMLPLGPVVFIDTAGIDDVGELGNQRIEKTLKIIERTDIAVIVCDYNGWNNFEENLAKIFISKNIPIIAVINKIDFEDISEEKIKGIKKFTDFILKISAKKEKEKNISAKVREMFIRCVPEEFINPPKILENLVETGDTVVLVTPVDKEAPKGRLIMPQVNVLRELLDKSCVAVVSTEKTLKQSLVGLKELPKLVITDSQAFKDVSEIIPEDILITSFSILFARLKGDLKEFVKGVKTVEKLKDNDKILICESCTHHEIADDIGRVKIPKLLKQKTGKKLIFEHIASHEFPKNINEYALIIHCGGCMTNRREILSRIVKSKEAGTPITNYGIIISYCLGILDRALKPFNVELFANEEII